LSLPGACPGRPSAGRRRAETGEDSTHISPQRAGEGRGQLAPDRHGVLPTSARPPRGWVPSARLSIPRLAGLPGHAPESAPPEGVAGHQGRTKPQGPSRLGPEASSPVAAPGSATRATSICEKYRLTHQGITYTPADI
jgi:hypothetical protein